MYEKFKDIENKKEFAYFLGFFWADGTINCKKYSVIEIQKDDADDLYRIFDVAVNFKRTERTRQGRKPQTVFFINDKDLADFFIRMGKYPGSVESHKNIIKWINKKYRLYFLRGLIDGDGCFYSGPANKKWRNNTVHFTIGSSINQEWDGIIELCQEFGLNLTVKKRQSKNGNSSIVRSSNFGDIENFVNKLYARNDEIWLRRKHDKIIQAIAEHHTNIEASKKRRKKYEIIYEDGQSIITDNLREFCMKNALCYECANRAANGNGRYKKMTIIKK